MAIGEEIDPAPVRSKVAGVQFVTPENHARAAERFEQMRGDPRVHRLELHAKPKDTALRSSLDRSLDT